MLSVRVGGTWLHSIGPYTDVTMTHVWPRGSEELTWRMRSDVFHPLLARGGALAEGFDGGIRVWRGKLAEPAATGEFSAKGSWSEAAGVFAIDGSGNATQTPDTAIDAAIARGAVSWTRPASLSAASWGVVFNDSMMTLLDLLDKAMTSLGKRWWVDADGAVQAAADPTTPTYYVPQVAAGRGLDLAEDDYYSHLIGFYYAGGPTWTTTTVGDADAAARWGYKEQKVDLLALGPVAVGVVTTQLTNMLAMTGARLGFSESLQLGFGQITTPGGTPVALSMPIACTATGGVMVRLMGVSDRTRVAESPVTDIVLGRSVYAEGAPTVTLTPISKAARDLRELILVPGGTE